MTTKQTPIPPSPSEIVLCEPLDLTEGGLAVGFDVNYQHETMRAFAIRFEGKVHAFLNRCSHVPMDLDLQPNRIFDDTGQWLICATHGAMYHPETGECEGGPCRGGLIRVNTKETELVVSWMTTADLHPSSNH